MKRTYRNIAILGLGALVLAVFAVSPVFAQEAGEAVSDAVASIPDGSINLGIALAILGAALATFGGGFGSSVGVGVSGEVGNGVLSEDEKKFGSVLLLQALPATQGIYGLLIAFIILGKLNASLSVADGLGIMFAALPITITGLISGIWQGKVSAASMQLIARKPKQMGQAMILPAMVETFAVFGLLISILLLGEIG
jgi:V/A-type H+-transporting ATPase subunit K